MHKQYSKTTIKVNSKMVVFDSEVNVRTYSLTQIK